jgi:hypothetical protein
LFAATLLEIASNILLKAGNCITTVCSVLLYFDILLETGPSSLKFSDSFKLTCCPFSALNNLLSCTAVQDILAGYRLKRNFFDWEKLIEKQPVNSAARRIDRIGFIVLLLDG